jgi:CBS domain-containing protein
MTKDVRTVRPDATLADVARQMIDHHLGAVPVVDEQGRLLGIVTEADLLRASPLKEIGQLRWLNLFVGSKTIADEYAQAHHLAASSVMSRTVISTTPDAALESAAALMEQRRVRRLPVCEPGGRLVGIVARADLLRAALPAAPRRLAEENEGRQVD